MCEPYFILRRAKYLGISYKEYFETPVFWTDWAAIAESAEVRAEKIAREDAKNK